MDALCGYALRLWGRDHARAHVSTSSRGTGDMYEGVGRGRQMGGWLGGRADQVDALHAVEYIF